MDLGGGGSEEASRFSHFCNTTRYPYRNLLTAPLQLLMLMLAPIGSSEEVEAMPMDNWRLGKTNGNGKD